MEKYKITIGKLHFVEMGKWAAMVQNQIPLPQSDSLPKISLSRKPGNCLFSVDKLEMHNYHTPPFNTEAELDEYIARVKGDIEKALAVGNVELELVTESVEVAQLPIVVNNN